MTHTLARNYDSDLSRTEVRAVLNNLAHELARAKGDDIPTKKVFKTPDIRSKVEKMAPEHHDPNEFVVEVLPTVAEEFEAIDDLLPSDVVRKGLTDGNGTFVSVLGADYETNEVHVIVRDARHDNEGVDFETYKSWFAAE